MAPNRPIHPARSAASSRQKRCSRRSLTPVAPRFVELDAAREAAAIGALADLLAPELGSQDSESLTCAPDGGLLGEANTCPKAEGKCQ
jgi:hypothetical protein